MEAQSREHTDDVMVRRPGRRITCRITHINGLASEYFYAPRLLPRVYRAPPSPFAQRGADLGRCLRARISGMLPNAARRRTSLQVLGVSPLAKNFPRPPAAAGGSEATAQ